MKVIIALSFIASVQAGLAGGWTDQDANNKEYMDLAWKYAAPSISKDASNNGQYALVPIKILSAKTQVVAGQNIELVIQVGPSNCKKTDALTAKACPVNGNAPTQVYRVVIFSQPWTNTVEVTSVKQIKN